MKATTTYRHPWYWVPSLYFAEGLPYVLVITVSVVYYKKLGISNTDIAFFTSLFYIPWMLKPLWSPTVDIISTKRRWILITQGLTALTLLFLAFNVSIQTPLFTTFLLFLAIALSSATHDIAADGFYMIALRENHQAAFVGVRNMFYRLSMITGQGVLIVLAGILEHYTTVPQAWGLVFLFSAFLMSGLALYHTLLLPHPTNDGPTRTASNTVFREFLRSFTDFFSKNNFLLIILFLFFYRFAEALLVKIVPLFLLDSLEKGGLGLTTEQVGFVYGTVGVVALVAGGLLGGLVVSLHGFRRWLWPMTLLMHVPDIVYIYLSSVQPPSIILISTALALEQFGYGFGFTAYSLFMIYVSEGTFKTSHYAFCTGIMALSMIVPGMVSGVLQEYVGYHTFFLLVLVATLPAFIVTAFVKVPDDFGKRSK